MHRETISIDLGASYTKVSHRRQCSATGIGTIREESRLLMLERSPLIPSLALQAPNGKWYFGHEAAGMTPNEEIKRHLNWKANIFRPTYDTHSLTASVIATEFFKWLHNLIGGAEIDIRNTEVRVALPAFMDAAEKGLLIAKCMELGGWDCQNILRATEPHANALGLFTCGHNVLGRNKHAEYLLNYGEMFGMDSGYVKRARASALSSNGGDSFHRVMVIDIGAFTTDIASLTFDVNSEQDGLTEVKQTSYAVGVINQLDQPFFAELEKTHDFSLSEISFRQTEQLKSDLYGGKRHSLLLRQRGLLEMGREGDMEVLRRHLCGFFLDLWERVEAHAKSEQPHEVRLTGGGS